ncbi:MULTISPECIES: hypothetical protein [unclassified Rhizobium]|uniref:hypothetical protein n=1 Tax=unclassified Rhizobium TaxID=2613769 RepID=UPI00288AAE29|nr:MULTISPECIES: hypothetical protein [unclassified Rhizobium]
MLEQDGAITAEPSTAVGSDYVVKIRNLIDIGFNPDDKPNREQWALRFLGTQCPKGRVMGEKVLETGTYGFGRPSRTYFMYVACK